MSFLKAQFDKLLLTGIILVLYLHPTGLPVEWVQRTLDIVLGALIAIISGRAFSRRSDSPNGNSLNGIT
jgi:hypothetical protein